MERHERHPQHSTAQHAFVGGVCAGPPAVMAAADIA
jgi:hypothetical protein